MSEETIYARGKMFELVHNPQPDGRVFELARRAPGVRVIIADKQERRLLLQREFRTELNDYDFRLPGGKVFDSLEEYDAFRETGKDIVEPAAEKAKAEAYEEAGIAVNGVELFKRSTLGATVEWDLFVFEATEWHKHEAGRALEAGEQIDEPSWFDFAEAEQMILRGELQEERIALALLQWLHQQ
jgi:ADP-ribose pyrophosphatase YjhB (NUDIX family)